MDGGRKKRLTWKFLRVSFYFDGLGTTTETAITKKLLAVMTSHIGKEGKYLEEGMESR